jgi:hypothetical protein
MMRRTLLTAGLVLFLGGTFAAPARAAPLSGLEGLGTPVSDQALDGMRGKFVAPTGVSYFGILMSSSWLGNDGITTSATLLLSIDFAAAAAGSSSGMPVVMISWSRQCPSCGDTSMDVSGFTPGADGYVAIPVGGLNTVNGVVQDQQIAGSDNKSINTMSIEIVPSGSPNLNVSGMTALAPGGQSQTFKDGDTLQFNYSNHQLGLAITDQNGALQQSVNGNLGQAAQNILIGGNNITALNSMSLMIGLDSTSTAQRLSVQSTLTSMKGLGF